MVRTAPLLKDHGLASLYTAELFNYSPAMQTYLQHGLELGRSFVQPHYWGSRSLDYLWHGIGAYLRKYPEVRYLLGPVTISAHEPAAARDWLVAYYDRFFGSEQQLAEARQPFSFDGVAPSFEGLDADSSFQILKQNLKQMGSRIPTLYKQPLSKQLMPSWDAALPVASPQAWTRRPDKPWRIRHYALQLSNAGCASAYPAYMLKTR
jgi:hypothetical protein